MIRVFCFRRIQNKTLCFYCFCLLITGRKFVWFVLRVIPIPSDQSLFGSVCRAGSRFFCIFCRYAAFHKQFQLPQRFLKCLLPRIFIIIRIDRPAFIQNPLRIYRITNRMRGRNRTDRCVSRIRSDYKIKIFSVYISVNADQPRQCDRLRSLSFLKQYRTRQMLIIDALLGACRLGRISNLHTSPASKRTDNFYICRLSVQQIGFRRMHRKNTAAVRIFYPVEANDLTSVFTDQSNGMLPVGQLVRLIKNLPQLRRRSVRIHRLLQLVIQINVNPAVV